MSRRLKDFVSGSWIESSGRTTYPVRNPATAEVIAETPLGTTQDVDRAVKAARAAFEEWRRVPPIKRARYLFELKNLLEQNFEELSAIVTRENGKTLDESRGSVRRGIECVEVATGAPSLLMGQTLEDIAAGIDCESIRQPLGVFACIAPFNFPAMVPLWFFPFALACGNTFIVKPSEQVPLSQEFIFGLLERVGLPSGVINLVNGGKEVVESLCSHPGIDGVSFVGSSPVAHRVYQLAAASGKRVQALGGAKNFMFVMPDASWDATIGAVSESAFGCAGERCLAGSTVIAVGDCHDRLRDDLVARAKRVKVGDGSLPDTVMGPVISAAHREKILGYIEKGIAEGAELVLDGRKAAVPGKGYFLGPSIFAKVTPEMTIAREEIFGPVMVLMQAPDLEAAMKIVRAHPLANASSIFTTSGKHARDFKYNVPASMTGINIGVAAPMSFFGFGGAKGSFFGDLKAHGRESFDFYTDRKVVISRWT